jgi:hypothetical protein
MEYYLSSNWNFHSILSGLQPDAVPRFPKWWCVQHQVNCLSFILRVKCAWNPWIIETKVTSDLSAGVLSLQFQVCICHARAVRRRSSRQGRTRPAQFENPSRMPRHCPGSNLKARSDHPIHVLVLSPVTNQKPSLLRARVFPVVQWEEIIRVLLKVVSFMSKTE